MSLFDDNLSHTSFVTAQKLKEIENSVYITLGRAFNEMYNPEGFDPRVVTDEILDNILSDLLSYIYYYVKLGLSQTQINVYECYVPITLFGLTQRNVDTVEATDLLSKITERLEKKGFRVHLIYNDLKLEISWRYAEDKNTILI